MHESAVRDAIKFAEIYLRRDDTLKIGDVGACDVNGNVRHVFSGPNWEYVGMDVTEGPNVDHVLKYDWLNVDVCSFDVIVSISTLEHVPKPWQWIRKLASRVKRGGLIYINAPNTWPFHEHPVDCWRVWPVGMKALFDEADIMPLSVYATGPDTTGIGRRM